LSHTFSPFCSLFWTLESLKLLPRLASNHDLWISASQVARVTSMSHQCPA
jgi:hypothetical protein